MSKRYALSGVSGTLELGKGGPLWKVSGADIQARNAADSAFINVSGLDATLDDHYITKRQFDAALAGLKWKEPVAAATTAAGTLATDFEDGDIIDGVTLVTGDRILLKNQATASENGIYVVNASGAPTRAADFDTGAGAASAAVFVSEGTDGGDRAYVVTEDIGGDVIGTDNLTFVQFAGLGSSLTSITNLGGGQALVVDGTTTTPDVKSLTSSGGTLTLSNSATEVNLDAANTFAVRQEQAAITFGDAGGTVNIGDALPPNAVVVQTSVNISTAFDAAATIDIGISGTEDLLMANSLINEALPETYEEGQQVTGAAGQQVIATIGASAATVGAGSVIIQYILTA